MSCRPLRLNAKLFLNYIQHVAAVSIAPVSDQLKLAGVLFYELLEKSRRRFFALDVRSSLLLKIVVAHRFVLLGGSGWTGYTVNPSRSH